MCLIVFAIDSHPDYKLVLAANRDEYFARPTVAADYWHDFPSILAGRDLRSGGTWLGVTRDGRVAAVTNYRDPGRKVLHPLSRGVIVADYLRGERDSRSFMQYLHSVADRCDGFNIIFGGSGEGFFYFSNRGGTPGAMEPGIHGLSNRLLDTPWPKVTAAKERLSSAIAGTTINPEELFSAMGDETPFPDGQLPDTGVGLERERLLSSIFIHGSDYGTRSTTLLLVDRGNHITFIERSYYPATTREFSLTAAPTSAR